MTRGILRLAQALLAAGLAQAALPAQGGQDAPARPPGQSGDQAAQRDRAAQLAPPIDQTPGAPVGPASPDRVLHLSLEEALAIALQNSISLQIEEESTDIARYVYIGSWGAFDPLLTAQASVTDQQFQASNIFQGAIEIDENTQQFGAGLSFPLLTGGTVSFGFDSTNVKTNSTASLADVSTTDDLTFNLVQPILRGAGSAYATSIQRENEFDWDSQRENQRKVRQDVLVNVEFAYWDLVASLEAMSVAQVTLDLGRAQREQNQRRLEAGVGTEVDVLQADANVAVRDQDVLSAQNLVRTAADRLKAALLGNTDKRNWDVDIVPTTLLPEQPTQTAPPWEAALTVAFDQRPELRQARLLIQRSEVALGRSKNEVRPQLDLVLNASSNGFDGDPQDALSTALGWDFPTASAALNFSFPIGNRRAKNAERVARAQLRQAHLLADQRELEITTEVRGAVRQVEFEIRNIQASVVSLALARRQLEAEEARYAEGLSTTFEVLSFQEQLAQALLTEKRARVNYVKALAALRKAQGLTGERTRP